MPATDPGTTEYGVPIHHNKRGVQYVEANDLARNNHIQELFRKAGKAFERMKPKKNGNGHDKEE